MLIRLDWRRFVDLVRLVIAKGGYKPQSLGLRKDGIDLLSISAPGVRKPVCLAACAPWDRPVVDAALMADLIRESRRRRLATAIFFTPGTFCEEAADLAAGRPVELVDAKTFLEVVGRLPAADQRHLFQISTAGQFDVPTCPRCALGMHQYDPAASGEISDLVLSREDTLIEPVRCARLTVARKAAVHFLGEVYAETMVVQGRAVGNFTCAGTVQIHRHGTLVGTLKARALDLQPGGSLDGDLTFLNGENLAPPETPDHLLRWRCQRCRLDWPTRARATRAHGH